MSIVILIIGILMFVGLVIAHEFGHFIVARRNGVDVEEFGLGFPPRAWSRKVKSGFVFSLNYLPLGGFVRLKGEHDADDQPGSFGAASISAKCKIMAAGVGMNLLVAWVILTFLALVGMPLLINNQYSIASDTKIVNPQTVLVQSIEKGSPAASLGLKANDELISIEGENGKITQIYSDQLLPSITQSLAGQEVALTYKQANGPVVTKDVRLRSAAVVNASENTKNPIGYLGIATNISDQVVVVRATWSAPIVALGLMKQITVLTFQGLGSAVAAIFEGHPSQATTQVTGPVGVVVLLKNGSALGIRFMLAIIAVISLSLAIINILPIPALDGGRLFFTVVPRLFRSGKPIKQRTEEWINGAGIAFIMLLFVLITIVDIKRFF